MTEPFKELCTMFTNLYLQVNLGSVTSSELLYRLPMWVRKSGQLQSLPTSFSDPSYNRNQVCWYLITGHSLQRRWKRIHPHSQKKNPCGIRSISTTDTKLIFPVFKWKTFWQLHILIYPFQKLGIVKYIDCCQNLASLHFKIRKTYI